MTKRISVYVVMENEVKAVLPSACRPVGRAEHQLQRKGSAGLRGPRYPQGASGSLSLCGSQAASGGLQVEEGLGKRYWPRNVTIYPPIWCLEEFHAYQPRSSNIINHNYSKSSDLVQPGPCSSSRLEMTAKRRQLVQSGFGKKMALRFHFYLCRQTYSAITTRNLDETYLIMGDSQSTLNYLAI